MIWEDDIIKEMRETQNYLNKVFHRLDSKILNFDKKFENYRNATVEYKENDNNFVLKAELPGIDKKDIKLSKSGNNVVIKAERKKEKKEGNKKEGKYKYEKSYAGFYQEVALPENADLDKMEAKYMDGVLKVLIPKKKVLKVKKEIKIK